MSVPTGYVEFRDKDTIRVFASPVKTIEAHSVDAVNDALDAVEVEIARGRHAAGFVAYEAAPAFDPAFETRTPDPVVPLVWFGIYDGPSDHPVPVEASAPVPGPWAPCLDRAAYEQAVTRVRDHIAAGDTYQVNFTFPTRAPFPGSGLAWFRERHRAQRGEYSIYINLGCREIVSLSPELFFALDGELLTSRPMKGTRPRGLAPAHDDALAAELRASDKEQAENLMIVDMVRNDMGRVCETSSVEVPALYAIERYPTVWQMTSTITGRTRASVPDIFRALFPCASVTGAPKIETMKIIRRLESGPRGVYCGAAGYWGPDRQARFSVAIRTATIDPERAVAHYPAGSGITWDSVEGREYAECLTKTAVLQHSEPEFELLASLRLEPGGYFLPGHHLDRLTRSAAYFGFSTDRQTLESALASYRENVTEFPAKVRLTVDRRGRAAITHTPLPDAAPWKVGLATEPVDTATPWFYHKTTARDAYDRARATRPDCTDVVLYTPAGYVTEATFANVVVELGGTKYTPPLRHGLLDGVYRRELLASGEIFERDLHLDDLHRAAHIYLINSVRKWISVAWVPAAADTVIGV